MPKSLYQQIKTLKEAEWNHYAGAPNNKSLSVPFITDRQSNLFIKEYFHKGGKDLVADYFNLDFFGKERAMLLRSNKGDGRVSAKYNPHAITQNTRHTNSSPPDARQTTLPL
jgi:hypothetical protein